jgi:P22 tail accessory factor
VTTKKRTIVESAYEELAVAGYQFDLDPAEVVFACKRLEMMVANWLEQYEVDLGYLPAADLAEIDPDDESGLTAGKIRPVVLKLAVEISRAKGKVLPPATLADAGEAFSGLLMHIPPASVVPSSMPVGAGYKNTGFLSEYFPGE